MLLRNVPAQKDDILKSFGEQERELIEKYANEAASPLNSHLLLKLLDATQLTGRTPLPQLPLELAIVEHCNG